MSPGNRLILELKLLKPMVGRRRNVITGNGREMVETVDTKNVTFCRKGGLDKQIRRLEARRLQPRVV